MLYLVDESKEYANLLRLTLYRKGLFCESLGIADFLHNFEKDPRAILVLPRPFTYGEKEKEALKSFSKERNIPLIFPEREEQTAALIISEIEKIEQAGECRYLSLRQGGISDDLRDATAKIFGLPVALTPKERMILRYMLYVFPEGATAKEIAHFCLSPDKELSLSNIPTHIRNINRAFSPCYGCRVITHLSGAYRLMENLPLCVN